MDNNSVMVYNFRMKVAFYTLGCKVNQYETEAMKEKFQARGHEVVSNEESEPADIYIINTCTVTNLADRKSRQFIRRAKRTNPDAFVAVTGCYAQVDPEGVSQIPGVDLIVGTNEKQSLVEYIVSALEEGDHITGKDGRPSEMSTDNSEEISIRVRDYDDLDTYCSDGIINAMESRTRAYIKIQEGCNRFCSYCIIPFARGKVRSRDEEEILEEAAGLVERGFKEIVLTGINTALYGADKNCESDASGEERSGSFGLARLLKRIDEIPGDFRVRLSSLEPTVVNSGDVESILDSKRLCPHLHLSIQSGSDNILKSMNRHYSRAEYLEIVNMLRDRNPSFGITTDIIVGFPGETEEDFSETMDLVGTAGFSKVHVFRYSPRRGTKAAEMTNQVPSSIKATRAQLLSERADRVAKDFLDNQRGSIHRVLLEESIKEKGSSYMVGYTDNYIKVYVPIEAIKEQGCVGPSNKLAEGCEEPSNKLAEGCVEAAGKPANKWEALANRFVKVKIGETFEEGVLGEIV